MSEKNNVCALRGCNEPARWMVNFTKPGVWLEVPVCSEHEPTVAPGSIVVDEDGNQVDGEAEEEQGE